MKQYTNNDYKTSRKFIIFVEEIIEPLKMNKLV